VTRGRRHALARPIATKALLAPLPVGNFAILILRWRSHYEQSPTRFPTHGCATEPSLFFFFFSLFVLFGPLSALARPPNPDLTASAIPSRRLLSTQILSDRVASTCSWCRLWLEPFGSPCRAEVGSSGSGSLTIGNHQFQFPSFVPSLSFPSSPGSPSESDQTKKKKKKKKHQDKSRGISYRNC
jgi:hypothetical protein